MKEITPLFYYLPDSPPDADELKTELEHRIEKCGLSLRYSELRTPGYDSPEIPKLKEWHHEGSTIGLCVMWASAQMTEFRLVSSHAAIPVKAGLAVLVDNQRIEHRMPPDATARWFYKGIVS